VPPQAKALSLPDIRASTAAYEAWLDAQLEGATIAKDLVRKHDLMAKSAFRFLRATYWRWCEVIPHVIPSLMTSPVGHAVGDLHMDNFGTFRDADGRLVWGVNDFDETAHQPLAFDLLRLAVSAHLRIDASTSADIAKWLIAGYRAGLAAPSPIVLDRDFGWLRELVHVADDERQEFWDDLAALKPGQPPQDVRAAITAAMPDDVHDPSFAPRTAGGGSLGRPRWIGRAEWRGGTIVREAKRLVPAAWTYVGHAPRGMPAVEALAHGPNRAPDPFYRQPAASILVRRLSPNNRKIEAKTLLAHADIERVIDAMGRDVGAIHAASSNAAKAMLTYTAKALNGAALARYTDQAVTLVLGDFDAWKAHHASQSTPTK
jgi:hypothetical protein